MNKFTRAWQVAIKAFVSPATASNRAVLVLCCLAAGCWAILAKAPDAAGAPSEQLLINGDFEKGTEGWDAIWAREAGAAKAVLDTVERHGGDQALRIEHTGRGDWSLRHSLDLKFSPARSTSSPPGFASGARAA